MSSGTPTPPLNGSHHEEQVPIKERLEIIVGPMFSGKSTELLRRIRRSKHAGKRVRLVKPKIDIRYSTTHVVTHDRSEEPATVLEIFSEVLQTDLSEVDVLGVDEAQFFPGLFDSVMTLLRSYPRLRIIVASLNADSNNHKFGEVWDLAPKASDVSFMKSVCAECGYENATRSACMIKKTDAVLVGGDKEYKPTCYKCHGIVNKS